MKRNMAAILILAMCVCCSGCQGNIANSSEQIDNAGKTDKVETDVSSGSTDQKRQRVVEEQDVVFINYKTGIITDNKIGDYNLIELEQYVEDENALYACGVCIYPYTYSELEKEDGESEYSYQIRQKVYRIEQAVELFLDRGLMVVEKYPYCLYNNETLYDLREDKTAYSEKYVEADIVVVGTYAQLMEIFDCTKEDEPWREFYAVMAPRPDLLEVMEEYIPEVDYTMPYKEETWVISYAKDLPDVLESEYCIMTIPVLTY